MPKCENYSAIGSQYIMLWKQELYYSWCFRAERWKAKEQKNINTVLERHLGNLAMGHTTHIDKSLMFKEVSGLHEEVLPIFKAGSHLNHFRHIRQRGKDHGS